MSKTPPLNRREFLALSSAVIAGALTGCGGGGGGGSSGGGAKAQSQGQIVFRLSGRGRRISNAAKIHNANFLFRTKNTADKNRAHPGDNSRIVEVVISEADFRRLFKQPKVKFIDLRKVSL